MGKCFISYRDVQPDERLAQCLERYLTQYGHKVFRYTQTQVGDRWAEQIEKNLGASDFFIVLLSKESIQSDHVINEVRLAYRLSQAPDKKLVILPIRVNFKETLPYELGVYLDSIQHILCTPDIDFLTIAEEIMEAIKKSGDRIVPTGPIELETGPVRLDSPFYVRRQTDEKLMEAIKKGGATVLVKGSSKTGKTSLLARAEAEARRLRYQYCWLDFQDLERSDFENLGKLFKRIAEKLSRALNTTVNPEEHWDDRLGAKDNLTEFIKEAILKITQSPILILLDEVDRVFFEPFRSDFFSIIRRWHNLMSTDKYWQQLILIIAHYTETYHWIKEKGLSPFNVGMQLELSDFNHQQAKELNVKHEKPLKTDDEIQDLGDFTGGQPFLMRWAFYKLAKHNYSLSYLREVAAEDSMLIENILRRFQTVLEDDKELKKSLNEVMTHGRCESINDFDLLRSLGLIKGDSHRKARIYCKLYEEHFKKYI